MEGSTEALFGSGAAPESQARGPRPHPMPDLSSQRTGAWGGDPRDSFWGEGAQWLDKVCPRGPCVASPPCSCFLSSSKLRVWRVWEQALGWTWPCVTPACARRSSALLQSLICSLGFSLPFPPPLPRSSPGSSGLAFPQGLLLSSRPLPDVWLPVRRNGYGWRGRRLSPVLPHPRGGGASIPRPQPCLRWGVLRVDGVRTHSPRI